MPEPRVSFIGASPDGIASHFKLDNSFSDRVGRMIEIKCPPSRVIKNKGEVHGEICPHNYWCQIQQQLECCDLELCDFWQCNIKEFYTREEWLNNDKETISRQEQDVDLPIAKQCMKGMILQFLPKKKLIIVIIFMMQNICIHLN